MGFLFLPLLLLAAGVEFPRPVGFVNDFAQVIPEQVEARIEALCRQIEKKTTAEVAVVTVRKVEPLTIEDYAAGLFERWGIGKRGKDNGVLILVAVGERKVRIEVGYGLEPLLTDAKCGSIIRSVLVPAFRRGDFGGGLMEAVRIIGRLISGGEVRIPSAPESSGGGLPWFFVALWQGFCALFGLVAAGLLGLIIIGGVALVLDAWCLFLGLGGSASAHYHKPLAQMLSLLVPFGLVFLISVLHGRERRAPRSKPWWWYGIPPTGGSSWGGGFGGGCSGGGGATGSW